MKYSALLTAIVHISASASAVPLVVNNANGVTYQGTSANGVEQFQNIFFGQSTAGERRFSPPQPYVPPNNSKINATAPGLACPQLSTGNPFVADVTIDNVSEDCLTLKIGRPAGTCATDKLPVMVWIYGGRHRFYIHFVQEVLSLPRWEHARTDLRPNIQPNRTYFAICCQWKTRHLRCCQLSPQL
jgi:hypothetical protein